MCHGSEVLKRASIGNEMFEMSSEAYHKSLLCTCVFQVLQVTAVFYSDLSTRFSSSSKQAGENTMNSHTLIA